MKANIGIDIPYTGVCDNCGDFAGGINYQNCGCGKYVFMKYVSIKPEKLWEKGHIDENKNPKVIERYKEALETIAYMGGANEEFAKYATKIARSALEEND